MTIYIIYIIYMMYAHAHVPIYIIYIRIHLTPLTNFSYC